MAVNIKMSEEVAVALGATAEVTLVAPPALQERFLGRAAFQDVEAVVTPTGMIMAFEFEPEEIRAIKNGKTQFLIHVYSNDGIMPFRLIFERMEFELNGEATPEETDNTIFRLQEPNTNKETD